MTTGYKVTNSDFNGSDLDDILMRREYFSDGSLWTWGDGSFGNLGDSTTNNRSSPGTTSGGGTTWKQSASGFNAQTAGIKTDGTLWTWGSALSGILGSGSSTASRSSPGTTSGGGTNWKQVVVGGSHMIAIKTDGTLWTWGSNQYGKLGDGSTTDRSSPGTVSGGGTTWKQVTAGELTSAAIKTDGTLWTWGDNNNGKLGDGSTVSRSSPGTVSGGGTTWKQVGAASSSGSHMTAIKTDGTLWTWGFNGFGELGDGSTTDRSSPGTTSGGGTNWKQVSGGYFITSAIKTDGTLWTWGYNDSGSLGDGSTTSRSSPGTVSGGGTNWKEVSSGSGFIAAIKTDGTLWTWGSNNIGYLGDGTTTNRSSPGTTSGGGTNWKQISCDRYNMSAVKDLTI